MADTRDRYYHIRKLYGEDVFQAVHNSRVLVVGAGGIGCELLKNIVISGFKNIVVLDLDTIDVSNLNRQFLFRKEHVGMPKAIVARDTVLKFNPDVSIEALHLPIQDSRFSTAYMSTFDIVLSALDNREARTYLNRLCFAARVPLVESGTSGYSGQCSPVIHGVTPCFECYNTNAAPKTFAVCTIRNTPELPVHCIAWAKFLFSALFGPQDESNVLQDLIKPTTTPEHAMKDTTPTDEDPKQFARNVLHRCFVSDIEAQITVKDRWVSRAPPIVQDLGVLLEQGARDPLLALTPGQRSLQVASPGYYYTELHSTLSRIKSARADEIGEMEFDKDDPDAMSFVAAAANLRMSAYHIPMISEFAAKGIAGNIIHAIATTNAIAAGFSTRCAVDLFRIVCEQKLTSTKHVRTPLPYIGFSDNPDNILTFSKDVPNENGTCFCTQPAFSLYVVGSSMTVGGLFKLLSKQLNFQDLSLDSLTSDKSFGFKSDYEDLDSDFEPESDDDKESLRSTSGVRKLIDCELSSTQAGIRDGSLLEVRDYDSNLSVIIRVNYRQASEILPQIEDCRNSASSSETKLLTSTRWGGDGLDHKTLSSVDLDSFVQLSTLPNLTNPWVLEGNFAILPALVIKAISDKEKKTQDEDKQRHLLAEEMQKAKAARIDTTSTIIETLDDDMNDTNLATNMIGKDQTDKEASAKADDGSVQGKRSRSEMEKNIMNENSSHNDAISFDDEDDKDNMDEITANAEQHKKIKQN